MREKKELVIGLWVLFVLAAVWRAEAAGNLTPKDAVDRPIETRAHHVQVTLNNGFARTEVFHTFFNPNATDLEAVYAFPPPEVGEPFRAHDPVRRDRDSWRGRRSGGGRHDLPGGES